MRTGTPAHPTALLAAQHARRIEVGGAQGGHDARQQRRRDQEQGHAGEGDRVGGADAEDERREEPPEPEGGERAERPRRRAISASP